MAHQKNPQNLFVHLIFLTVKLISELRIRIFDALYGHCSSELLA